MLVRVRRDRKALTNLDGIHGAGVRVRGIIRSSIQASILYFSSYSTNRDVETYAILLHHYLFFCLTSPAWDRTGWVRI